MQCSQEPAPCSRPSGFEARILRLTRCSLTLLESGLRLRNRQTVIEATLWGMGVKLNENLYTSLWQNCKANTGSSTSPDSTFNLVTRKPSFLFRACKLLPIRWKRKPRVDRRVGHCYRVQSKDQALRSKLQCHPLQ